MAIDKEKPYSTIRFKSLDRSYWFVLISSIRNEYERNNYKNSIILSFKKDLSPKELMPFHFVTLACLIEFLSKNNHTLYINSENDSIRNMIIEDLKFNRYWSGKQNHVDSDKKEILNLWRIVDNEKDIFASRVAQYFNNKFFINKDLSIVNLSIVESFYNIFDHAEANGNAFSFIKFDKDKNVLYIAICDFGIGISSSVRKYIKDIDTDEKALKKAIEAKFTVGSKQHNAGMGLDNIISCASTLRIICNNAFLYKDDIIKVYSTDYNFTGTLIYFDISMDKLEDIDVLDSFDF